jgi:hypothetical protein
MYLLAVPPSPPVTHPILESQKTSFEFEGNYDFVLEQIEQILKLFGIKFLRQKNFFECMSFDNFEEKFETDFEIIVFKKQDQFYQVVLDDLRQRSLSAAPMPPPPM